MTLRTMPELSDAESLCLGVLAFSKLLDKLGNERLL